MPQSFVLRRTVQISKNHNCLLETTKQGLRKRHNQRTNRHTRQLKLPDGTLTPDNSEKANLLNKYFCTVAERLIGPAVPAKAEADSNTIPDDCALTETTISRETIEQRYASCTHGRPQDQTESQPVSSGRRDHPSYLPSQACSSTAPKQANPPTSGSRKSQRGV